MSERPGSTKVAIKFAIKFATNFNASFARLSRRALPGRAALLLLTLVTALNLAAAALPDTRPRLLVLTDIGGDPDDQQSMIRLLHYANEFEIEGLVASASGIPGELKEAVTKPHLIHELIDAYEKVRDNLALHDPRYPHAGDLRARVTSGNPQRGRQAVGAQGDTEASRWIIQAADRQDARPLNITIWGGQTDLAQALWRVRQDRGPDRARPWMARLRVYDIGDQDELADWLLQEFPDVFYVLPRPGPGEDRRETVYRGMYLGGDESLTSRDWVDTHIRRGHGPLGALYPTRTWTAPNPHSTLKEGDTPSWFFFLPNGLGDPVHPDWGGWGGRFALENGRVWRDASDTVGGETHRRVTVWRWRPQFQAGFQARLDWAVRPPTEANHTPEAVVDGDRSGKVLERACAPGAEVRLDASGSSDPDGDALSFRWWWYAEPGDGGSAPAISAPTAPRTTVTIPAMAGGRSLHLILEVTDDGEPALTGYRRVVLRVQE